jgi:transcriptional regulator
MYVPKPFVMDDREELFAHIAANPFATLITQGDEGPLASHVPLLAHPDRGVLVGHIARENPQLSHLETGAPTLAIFHGPHGYVSPSVYAEPLSVPTWNYVVVHVRGRPRVVGEPALRQILDETVARFDTTGWRLSDDPGFLRKMLDKIAGFEVGLDQVVGKKKISQNRPAEDVPNVVRWLERGDDASRALARIMREMQAKN